MNRSKEIDNMKNKEVGETIGEKRGIKNDLENKKEKKREREKERDRDSQKEREKEKWRMRWKVAKKKMPLRDRLKGKFNWSQECRWIGRKFNKETKCENNGVIHRDKRLNLF